MTDMDVVFKAIDWMKENDPEAYEDAWRALEDSDVETLEELVAGVPDRVTGRKAVGDDD